MKTTSRVIPIRVILIMFAGYTVSQKIECNLDWNWFWVLSPLFLLGMFDVIGLSIVRWAQCGMIRLAKKMEEDIGSK